MTESDGPEPNIGWAWKHKCRACGSLTFHGARYRPSYFPGWRFWEAMELERIEATCSMCGCVNRWPPGTVTVSPALLPPETPQ